NMHEIANNPDIDVVYIVLPTGLHAKYSIIGAEAGKHVWCEKPMARDTEECKAMISACKKNNVQLTIGYRMQHEPNTQSIIALGKEKPFGKIEKVIVEAGYNNTGDSHGWRADANLGGGAMYDTCFDVLNANRYTIGAEPVTGRATMESACELYNPVDKYS